MEISTPSRAAPAVPGEPSRHPHDRLRRQLSLFDAAMLVVASVIGVGIFLTPGFIADTLPAPGLIAAVWILGGILSLAGALANAELGSMYPHAGGDYVYLREAYHPLAGFLAGWLTFFAIYAGTVATLAVGFAESLAYFVPLGPLQRTAVAVLVTVVASWINYLGVRAGARTNNASTLLKLAAIVALVALGPLLGRGDVAHFAPVLPADAPLSWTAFGLALSPVLFCYLGWNACVYVASEIEDPHRNIPRSLFVGLGICTAVYFILNLAYLYALPIDQLRGNPRVGEATARALFGEAGGAIGAALILVSAVSCLNATILVGPRIAYAMALDGLFFRGVDRVHAAHETPHVAVVVQALTAILLITLLRTFPSVLDYTTFAILVATMADTSALYVLRWRRPHHARPYRAWGYPLVPALYLLANAAIAVNLVRGRPLESGVALAVGASGVIFYARFVRSRA